MNVDEIIFNLYKDKEIKAKTFRSEIKRKYKLKNIEISNIYERINNYQIKTYGSRLERSSHTDWRTKEDNKRIRINLNANKYYRLKKRGGE